MAFPDADGGPHVLVIDDDRALANLMRAFLRRAGYTTSVALDATAGVATALRELPALILLDLQIPSGGGLAILECLRHSDAAHAIPVVVVTAEESAEAEQAARASGAVDLLRKPIDRDTLLATVETALGRSSLTH